MARTFSSANNLAYPSNYNGTPPVTALPFTLAAWGRFTATSAQNVVSLCSTNTGTYAGLTIGNVTAGRVCAVSAVTGAEISPETTTGITTNTWHHCCAVFASATSRTAYIDGGSSASSATSNSPSGLVNLTIGSLRNSDGTQWGPVSGQIAEVGVWNVALTASEVAALARGIPPFRIRPGSLVAYWPIHGLDSPERDWKPSGIATVTRYSMTLVGTPPIYGGHAAVEYSFPFGGYPLLEFIATEAEAKYPDAIVASTNLAGTVANIDEDPDSPDASWLTATDATAVTDVRVSFPTPTGVPSGSQNFRALLRKTTGTPTPTIDLQLYQGGSLVSTILNDTAITNTTGEVVQGNWSAGALTGTVDGSDVECRIVSTVGSNAPTTGELPAYSAVGTAETLATMAGTFDVAIPTHASGDLLVLHVLTRNTNNDGLLATINTAGWTQGGGTGTAYGGTQNARVGFGWKIGDGSETVVNVTTTGGATSDRRLSRVYMFTATNGFANPPVSNISTATTGSSTALGMPTVATTSGGNQLAVALLASSVSSTVAAATDETGGNWTEPVGESTGTNGVIAIQVSDQSAASSISGGTATLGTTGVWVAVGFRLNPADIAGSAVNTVEIGAIEWNVSYIAPVGGGVAPIAMANYMRRRLM